MDSAFKIICVIARISVNCFIGVLQCMDVHVATILFRSVILSTRIEGQPLYLCTSYMPDCVVASSQCSCTRNEGSVVLWYISASINTDTSVDVPSC